MKNLVIILSIFVFAIVIWGFIVMLKTPPNVEKGKVRESKFLVIFGIISTTLLIIPTILCALFSDTVGVSFGFLFFALLSSTLIIAFINCRIFYTDEYFVYKNFFGIKKKFTYEEVSGIRNDISDKFLHVGNKTISINALAVGGIEFLAAVQKGYKKAHDGKQLPRITKSKYDIFNGNLHNVSGHIAAYALCIVIGIVCIVLGILITTKSFDIDNTLKSEMVFTSFVVERDDIVIKNDEDIICKIHYVNDGFDTSKIQRICDGKTALEVYYCDVDSSREEDYYSIKAIYDRKTCILSFDESNLMYRHGNWFALPIMCIMALIMFGFVAISIVIGRNPQKFSKKIVYFFFRKEYIKY